MKARRARVCSALLSIVSVLAVQSSVPTTTLFAKSSM